MVSVTINSDPPGAIVDVVSTPIESYSYLIYTDGSTVFAKNGSTGNIDYSGEVALTVIQNALDNLTAARTWKEKVIVKGNYTLINSSTLDIPDYTIFELDGRFIASDKTKTLVTVGNNVEMINGIYDGNRDGTNGGDIAVRVIHINGKDNVLIHNLAVEKGYSRGIEVDYSTNVIIENVQVNNCWRNLMQWVEPADLSASANDCFLSNIHSTNALENGFDGTCSNLTINDFYDTDAGSASISIDGFKNITINNVTAGSQINILAGDYVGVMGSKANLSNITGTYLFFDVLYPIIENVKINNVYLDGDVRFIISGTKDVKNIEINNLESKSSDWAGILFDRGTGSSGRYKNVLINNAICRDGAQHGFYFRYVDHLKITNSIAIGNDDTGFVIADSTYTKMISCDSVATGAYNQECPLELNTVNNFDAIDCFFENGGIPTTLTNVTNYVFSNCKGDIPDPPSDAPISI